VKPPNAVAPDTKAVSFDEACDFIRLWHRHHAPPQGYKYVFGVAIEETGELVGVAIIGRPVARHLWDGRTLEVTRVAVADDMPGACSKLYAEAWKGVKAFGFKRLITYTQEGESGSSLRALKWRVVAEIPPRPGWDTPGRRRLPKGNEHVARTLWEAA
jgi:hypothetical protein